MGPDLGIGIEERREQHQQRRCRQRRKKINAGMRHWRLFDAANRGATGKDRADFEHAKAQVSGEQSVQCNGLKR